ncbi:hypothetical protein Rhe02_06560 [Rhizocola hellebori]|uniref:S8 family peptidase n=1 Tax=Rhizocola hellebori TaxID=1392758 RepID=A0A8J3VCI4_9ACTN|nr:S8 family peptidase [Rhizocola hellebori]GIH02589.1 hypothetical protein Rhe02_06560 [Rhizocola hellebori]
MKILPCIVSLGVIASLTLPSLPATAVGAVRPTAGQAVPGSYLVVLKKSASVDGTAAALTTRHGGTVGHVYRHALNGFAVQASPEEAKRMAADPAVDYIQQDGIVSATVTQLNPPSWGLDRIDRNARGYNSSYDYPSGGAGVHVYVLDTGVRASHQDFGGRVTSGWDFVDDDNNASDCYGHGTHVAGTIGGTNYGVAKSVDLVSVRVLDCDGNGWITTIVAGIDWVTEHAVHPAVANMSLGGYVADTAMDDAVAGSIASGVTYVVSAGNGYGDGVTPADACLSTPARTPTAITVSGTDRNDRRWSPLNYGTCVDIFAPGFEITSASNAGDQASQLMSGTSMAAPHVAGAAAILLGNQPTLTPAEVADQILNRDPTVGVVVDPRAGSPNKLLFVRSGPLRVNVFCQSQTGSWSCQVEAIGAVGPNTTQWSPSSSGICRIDKTITAVATVTDSLGASASSSRTFACRPRCGLQSVTPLCISDPTPPGQAVLTRQREQ